MADFELPGNPLAPNSEQDTAQPASDEPYKHDYVAADNLQDPRKKSDEQYFNGVGKVITAATFGAAALLIAAGLNTGWDTLKRAAFERSIPLLKEALTAPGPVVFYLGAVAFAALGVTFLRRARSNSRMNYGRTAPKTKSAE